MEKEFFNVYHTLDNKEDILDNIGSLDNKEDIFNI